MEQGADINEMTVDGTTCFYKAAEYGKLDVVKYIMNNHKIDINLKKISGRTPLYTAATNDNIEVVKELVENGTNINIDAEDNEGMTPLLGSCFFARVEVIKYLVSKGANLKAKTNDGTNCLILASGMECRRLYSPLTWPLTTGDCGNATAFRELLEINKVLLYFNKFFIAR